MLTIDRRLNECIYVGNTKIEILDIKERDVLIEIDDKTIRLKHGQNIRIGDTEVFMLRKLRSGVQLGFDGPRSTTILRGELYEKGKGLKYIDNSTKQFPSGNF